jgi:phosphoglycolate phosphatase
MALRVLEHWNLAECFEAVFAGTLDEEGCVKSAIVERAAQWCGSEAKGRILMIGDREYDVRGAHANAIPCAGVLWGYGSREEFEAVGAEYIVADAEELIALANRDNEL